MVRNPLKVLTKLGMTHKRDTPAGFLKRLLTTATCEGFLARGVPILQEYCRKFILAAEAKMSRRQLRRKYMSTEALSYRMQHLITRVGDYNGDVVTMETRESFARAFGLSVSEQLRVEEQIRKWSFDLGCTVPAGDLDDLWFFRGPYPEYS